MKLKDFFAPRGKSKAGKLLDSLKGSPLDEGRKYVDVNNREKIGIDKPHVAGQQFHAHLENGRAVNQDGSLSHGGKPFYLTNDQAAALEKANFQIPTTRLIEREDDGMVTIKLDRVLVEFLLDLQDSQRQ